MEGWELAPILLRVSVQCGLAHVVSDWLEAGVVEFTPRSSQVIHFLGDRVGYCFVGRLLVSYRRCVAVVWVLCQHHFSTF